MILIDIPFGPPRAIVEAWSTRHASRATRGAVDVEHPHACALHDMPSYVA